MGEVVVAAQRSVAGGEHAVGDGGRPRCGGVAVPVPVVVLEEQVADVQQAAGHEGVGHLGDDRSLDVVVDDAREDGDQQGHAEGAEVGRQRRRGIEDQDVEVGSEALRPRDERR